jgi:hypothetical protein
VWYHPQGTANILSLSCIEKNRFIVTYYSSSGTDAFKVTKPNVSVLFFERLNRELFYLDTRKIKENGEHFLNSGTALVTTVAENESNFTNREYERATLARCIQKTIGHPSTRDFIKYVDNLLLPNCPFNPQ